MSAIDSVKAHFSRQMVRKIEVPEWAGEDGQPMIIYAHPLTLSEKQRLRTMAQTGGEMEILVNTLIMKAEDSEGKKRFDISHKHDLMNRADPDLVARVVMQITRPRSEDELEKK
jgi:hypothetical protein